MNKSQCVCSTSGSAGPTSVCSRVRGVAGVRPCVRGGALGVRAAPQGLCWVVGAAPLLSAGVGAVRQISGSVYSAYA